MDFVVTFCSVGLKLAYIQYMKDDRPQNQIYLTATTLRFQPRIGYRFERNVVSHHIKTSLVKVRHDKSLPTWRDTTRTTTSSME